MADKPQPTPSKPLNEGHQPLQKGWAPKYKVDLSPA